MKISFSPSCNVQSPQVPSTSLQPSSFFASLDSCKSLTYKFCHLSLEDPKSLLPDGMTFKSKLKLDPSQLECEWNGKQLPDKLTTTEFLLVKELAKRPGIIKERAQLMDIAYREDTDIEDRTIDSHVKRIRKKFKKVDPEFSAIETRYGSGYRWNVS